MDRDKIIKIMKMSIDIEKHNAKVEERSIDIRNIENILDTLISQVEKRANLFNWKEGAWEIWSENEGGER